MDSYSMLTTMISQTLLHWHTLTKTTLVTEVTPLMNLTEVHTCKIDWIGTEFEL
jgi:hypothetical protein